MSKLTNMAMTDTALPTTNGVIALLNLQAQITGLEALALRLSNGSQGCLTVAQRADLIDLRLLRGQIQGCIADNEDAATLAEELVQDAPTDRMAWLARAKTHATFHRFAAALADLDAAAQVGAEDEVLNAERAAIYQALGDYDEALVCHRSVAGRQPAFATLGALAGLEAERGAVTAAERLFNVARQCYQGISPFPIALLDFQRGLLWLEQGDLPTARTWFAAAHCRLPAYVQAQGHLAEVDAALGNPALAITRLRPLTALSDDPEYPALLAGYLSETGQEQEAEQWQATAAARYDELLARHPAAFADHAAEFWLTAGKDAGKALDLAAQNLANRQTPRAHALFQRAVRANVSH